MARYLIDVNLPARLALWNGPDFIHVRELDERWTDSQIWDYALTRNLVIVTKDADFTKRAIVTPPPPRVVQICVGNTSLRDLRETLEKWWPIVEDVIDSSRVVSVFRDAVSTMHD